MPRMILGFRAVFPKNVEIRAEVVTEDGTFHPLREEFSQLVATCISGGRTAKTRSHYHNHALLSPDGISARSLLNPRYVCEGVTK